MNYNDLVAELLEDPLARGYAQMTDAEVAASLNEPDRQIFEDTLNATDLFEAIDIGEFLALDDTNKQYLRDILSLGDGIQVGPGTKARSLLLDIFGVGSLTVANLVTLLTRNISRAQELGLLPVREGDVQKARSS